MKRPFAGSSRTSTSAVAESLTEDIVIEILLRLPAKSLMRFKCVDKRWRSLISDPGFAMSHLQRLKAGDIISSQRIFKTCPFETINYEVLDGGIRGDDDDRPVVESQEARMDDSSWYSEHVGSCDGLLCLSVLDRFVLYNPTTQERRNLPSSDLCRLPEILHGFGYDSRSDDYKIVQLKGYEKWQGGSENWRVLIFSLKSGSWKRKRAQLEGQLIRINRGGVYWNGALHWCVIEQSEEKVEPLIVSFDLSEEKFRRVLPVPELNGDTRFKGLGIHGANLFMYHCTYNGCFQGWITSEYGKGGSWTKLFRISTEGILGYNHWQIIPVTCTRSGKIVFQLDASHIILFNPEDNTHEDYPIQNFSNIYSAIYVETLVSPCLGCEPSRI